MISTLSRNSLSHLKLTVWAQLVVNIDVTSRTSFKVGTPLSASNCHRDNGTLLPSIFDYHPSESLQFILFFEISLFKQLGHSLSYLANNIVGAMNLSKQTNWSKMQITCLILFLEQKNHRKPRSGSYRWNGLEFYKSKSSNQAKCNKISTWSTHLTRPIYSHRYLVEAPRWTRPSPVQWHALISIYRWSSNGNIGNASQLSWSFSNRKNEHHYRVKIGNKLQFICSNRSLTGQTEIGVQERLETMHCWFAYTTLRWSKKESKPREYKKPVTTKGIHFFILCSWEVLSFNYDSRKTNQVDRNFSPMHSCPNCWGANFCNDHCISSLVSDSDSISFFTALRMLKKFYFRHVSRW